MFQGDFFGSNFIDDPMSIEPTLKVVEGKFGLRAPEGLSAELRRMADAADRGELTELVACYTEGDDFCFI